MFKWLDEYLEKRRDYQLLILDKKNEHELSMRICQSCETLKTQLEYQNQLVRELTNPVQFPVEVNTKEFEPIRPKHIPWAVRRSQLQKADRELAEKLRQEKQAEVTVDNLDMELESLGDK